MTTPTNSPVRAATAPELVKFRGDQAVSLGIAIEHPATVYSCRINQDFTTTGFDGVSQITYDGGSGTLANVKEGMTVFIGSAAGLYDRLITRVRKTPTATVLYIGMSSVFLADNDYITIVDSFGLFPRDLANGGGSVNMDYDIYSGDLTRGGIIARLGPVSTVINQTSGTITFTPPNPSLSAAYEEGVTIVSYTFAAPGASTTANLTDPATASWTYPLTANQEYRWSCAIVDSLGRTTTGYRRVFVNPTEIPFTLESCGGSFDDGGWSFDITNYADVSAVYPRAMVTLYTRDYYGGVIGSIGKLAGYENILAVGWIDGESIEQDSQKGTVSFTVRSAAYWMDKTRAYPLELTDTGAAETSWNTVRNMTVDRALARLIYWTSTAPLFMDIFLTGNTDPSSILPASSSSLLSQINSMADTVFAKALVNSYGQMFINVDAQILDSTDRNALTVVMDITSADYEAPINIERNLQGSTAMIELGAGVYDGTTSYAVFSRAPGNIPQTFGDISSYDNYFVVTQTECNRIAGALLANENNPYEPLDISFAANIRLLDIAPAMYCTITTSSASNPRGIALTAQKLIPRNVSYSFNNGVLKTSASFEVATSPVDGVTYYPPTVEDENIDDGDFGDFDGIPDLDFPDINTEFPPTVPPEVVTPCAGTQGNAFSLSFSPRILTGITTTLVGRASFPCMIRAGGSTGISIAGRFIGDALSNYAVYGVLGGSRIIGATVSGRTATFNPVSDTQVDGFEIELASGFGTLIELGNIVGSGTVQGTDAIGVSVPVNIGQTYAIEATGGPFYQLAGEPSWASWKFDLDGSGQVGYLLKNDTFYLSTPSGAITCEAVDSLHGRVYFAAAASSVLYRTGDGVWNDNSGSLGYLLRYAIGRRIELGTCTLYNVCAIP